ncbi:PA3496 family putative envelope integrity protein [Thalassotalea profundi]|uniref:DUF3545 family protein n=1 Tax=Thalassotalea profundi TaxID=2036687 RepID=A0ABQ3INE6_9GAMM|nr:hypothetical protein [Thalassotalea profundi]GHE87189.1 hypothetical protein GCM10011501_15680 [Thalassotalea profundi]
MTYDSTNNFNDDLNDDIDDNVDNENETIDHDNSIEARKKQSQSAQVRKRIDDLLEKKRLKELLDDTDDW